MDVGKSFSFVFEDPRWLNKVLLGALFSFLAIFIIGFLFVLGYFVELIRNVANGVANPLPEWDNLGDKLVKGLILAVVFLVYSIPAILLISCSSVFSGIAGSSTGFDDNTAGAAGGILGLVSCCFSLLYFVYLLLLGIAYPVISIRYAITNSFGACFQFGQMFRFITANAGTYIIAILISLVAYFISGIGIIALCVGVFFTWFYSYLIMGHIYGQLYRESVNRGTAFPTV